MSGRSPRESLRRTAMRVRSWPRYLRCYSSAYLNRKGRVQPVKSYDAQVIAAMRRCLEVHDYGGPWGFAADSVQWALRAYDGDPEASNDLDTNPAWQLTAEGDLP